MTTQQTHKDLVKLVLESAQKLKVHDGGIELDSVSEDKRTSIRVNAKVHHDSVPYMETAVISQNPEIITAVAQDVLGTFGGNDYFDASFIGFDENKERKYRFDAHSLNWLGKLAGKPQRNGYGTYNQETKLTFEEFKKVHGLLDVLGIQYDISQETLNIHDYQRDVIGHERMAKGFAYAIENGIDTRLVSNNHVSGVTLKNKPTKNLAEVSIIQAGNKSIFVPGGIECLTENRIYPVERFVDLRLVKLGKFEWAAKEVKYVDAVKNSIAHYPKHPSNTIVKSN